MIYPSYNLCLHTLHVVVRTVLIRHTYKKASGKDMHQSPTFIVHAVHVKRMPSTVCMK